MRSSPRWRPGASGRSAAAEPDDGCHDRRSSGSPLVGSARDPRRRVGGVVPADGDRHPRPRGARRLAVPDGIGALLLLPIALARGALAGLGRQLGPIFVLAMVQLAGPFLLIGYGAVLLGEPLTAAALAGLALVVAGSALAAEPFGLPRQGIVEREDCHGRRVLGSSSSITSLRVSSSLRTSRRTNARPLTPIRRASTNTATNPPSKSSWSGQTRLTSSERRTRTTSPRR